MKIAIDIHGTIDWDPDFWRKAIPLFISMGHSVHIMSGPSEDEIRERLEKLGIDHRDIFIESMTEYLKENHSTDIYYEKDQIWTSEEIWWTVKARLCASLDIDVLIDDHYEYFQYEIAPNTRFILYQKGRLVLSPGNRP